MKTVKLQSLTMKNFRGEKERTTTFNPDGLTTIQGANGLGKTRHFDALVWLFFGKDTQDRKDYNVRTVVNGEPIHKVECSVEATILIDKGPVKLKRCFNENWVKPRGQAEEVFKGNITECFWNNVPINVTDYQNRINEIVNDSIFKMISMPHYFLNIDWKLQREQLFQIAGTISDREIASMNPEFSALLDRISGKSFSDFKKELSAKKRRLKDNIEQIQPRIDQTQKLMPDSSDYTEIEKQIKELEKQINDIDSAISDGTKAFQLQTDALNKKQKQINDLKQEQQEIIFYAQKKAREDEFSIKEKRSYIENEILSTEREVEILQREIKNMEKSLEFFQNQLTEKKQNVTDLRGKWTDENKKEFQGDETCHTCGQPLPENMKADAQRLFSESKQKILSEITENGKLLNDEITGIEKQITETQKSIDKAVNEVLGKESIISSLKDELLTTPKKPTMEIIPNEIPEFIVLQKQIDALNSELNSNELDKLGDINSLRGQKTDLSQDLLTLKTKLSERELIEKYKEEIKSLEKQGRNIAQQIADLEHDEYILQQFNKVKIDECEKRINGMFTQLTFKLFDYTIDGNEIETCIPLVNGVPYPVANTAGQINSGLDVINTLVNFYEISVPIFIDHAESVIDILPTKSQMIFLKVSNENKLTII